MRFTSRSRSENFHSASREMSKSHFLRIDTSATSGKALLVDESGVVMSDLYCHRSQNTSRSLFLLWQPLIVVFAGLMIR